MHKAKLAQKHSLDKDLIFKGKSYLHIAKRWFSDLSSPIKKFPKSYQLITEPILAFSESDLWNPHDNKENWILTAGKIQNLRLAAKKLHGLEIKANEIFSFWKHIGNPNFGKGYVVGREIREGCIVPTVAGGLCQISNALYDAALKANFEILERHRHTKVIPGSLAEQDRDATVKWNYIDLRFRSKTDFRLEVELNSEKLIVLFKSKKSNLSAPEIPLNWKSTDKVNDCYSCGNTACFKHHQRTSESPQAAITTFVLDEKWPELDEYIHTIVKKEDQFILSLQKNKFIRTDRYNWTSINGHQKSITSWQGWKRALQMRFASAKTNVYRLSLKLDKQIALAAAQKIPIHSTHLVISQNLLPFLYENGSLGGRTFDVLMTRLPLGKLQERLDFAHSKHPESNTLNDFRVTADWIQLENIALNKARKIITPHQEIADLFNHKSVKLNWVFPKIKSDFVKGKKILFPATVLGRRGAYEIREIAKELNIKLTVLGQTIESSNFWEGIAVEKFNGNWEEIGLVIYPTYVDNQPRIILKAMAMGIPVITTTACGIAPNPSTQVINTGDLDRLKLTVSNQLENFK